MGLVVPPGFAEIAIQLRAVGDPDPWYVTFGVDASAAAGDIDLLGQACITAYTNMMTKHHTIVSLTGCNVTLGQDGPDSIRQFVAATTDIHGGEAGDKLPQNCALLLRKNTGGAGRRARGRMFLPLVVAEGAASNVGVISPDALATYQASGAAFLDGLAPGDPVPAFPMVILHSTGGSAVPDPTPVTSVTADNVIATQRRRLR